MSLLRASENRLSACEAQANGWKPAGHGEAHSSTGERDGRRASRGRGRQGNEQDQGTAASGLAWKRYSRQTPLRDVAPALNGRASLAGVRPCRTAGARVTETGNTATALAKRRRNGRACGRRRNDRGG